MSGFKSLRTVNLTSKTKNVAEGRKWTNEDAELEALLDEDSCQKQKELALRSDSNNFISFEIIGNNSKARELCSI